MDMKRLLFCIFAMFLINFSSADAFASDDDNQHLTSERLEKEIATVSPTSSGITLTVNGENVERFYIFSITGQLVKTVDVESSEVLSVELPRGCYIVKCAHWSKKVMVK